MTDSRNSVNPEGKNRGLQQKSIGLLPVGLFPSTLFWKKIPLQPLDERMQNSPPQCLVRLVSTQCIVLETTPFQPLR